MASDPYYQVKSEVESTLQTLEQLHSTYTRLSRTSVPSGGTSSSSSSSNQELAWSLSELKATLILIEGDVEELDESVLAIEEFGVAKRLGITEPQVKQRRMFVDRVKQRVQTIRQSLPNAEAHGNGSRPIETEYDDDFDGLQDSEAYEMQHQTLLLEQQDRTLTDISGTVDMLRQQARVMGQEVYDQNLLLDDIDAHVDSTTNRLGRAQSKMNKFINDNKSSPSSWLVLILTIVLCILLFIVVFV
ncbi:hypothetical protein OIO90_003983 [Microbotryomycetes sp. JL221]|nr:hypothetical protein OIO90_003983 [Microbotryomycetes sp. JL221]